MVSIPLGHFAYKRQYAGAPEIRLENRFLEAAPSNLREQATLLTRSGSQLLDYFTSAPGPVTGNRANFDTPGLFDGDLFVVSGPNLYRKPTSTPKVQIEGIINGAGAPTHAYVKGIGYQHLFIADGLLLQYYDGGSQAHGTLTGTPTPGDIVQIGTTYYGWATDVTSNLADGTLAHPFLALSGGTDDNLTSLGNLLNFDGIRGVDFSPTVPGPNPLLGALANGGPPATSLLLTATSEFPDGNTIVTLVHTGSDINFANATLIGGGVQVLHGVAVPDGQGVRALTQVSSFVLVSIANSQKFYWINPGETTIDPLNFAEKESQPDNIVDMLCVGDQALIMGTGSTENWYATGDADAPLLPVEGRVFQRGVVPGTAVLVKDGVMLVGDDGVVYNIGYASGQTTGFGVNRISTHAIEERIRYQLRQEQGLG
jgi:hypothetical protein